MKKISLISLAALLVVGCTTTAPQTKPNSVAFLTPSVTAVATSIQTPQTTSKPTVSGNTQNTSNDITTTATLTNNTLSATYPASWQKKVSDGYVNFVKMNHTLEVSQLGTEGKICFFEQPTEEEHNLHLEEFTLHATKTKYVSIPTSLGVFRRTQADEGHSNYYFVCSLDRLIPDGKTRYSTITDFGQIYYETPAKADQSLLKEMDAIVASLKIVK